MKVNNKFSNSKKQLDAYNKISLSNIGANYTLTNYINLPDWLKSINAYPMFLGLDLKGGVHFLLQVDKDNIKTNLLREIEDDVKKYLNKVSKLPVGEIYLNSIDKDGTGMGLDFSILNFLPKYNNKSIIMSGGSGNSAHIADGLKNNNIDYILKRSK